MGAWTVEVLYNMLLVWALLSRTCVVFALRDGAAADAWAV